DMWEKRKLSKQHNQWKYNEWCKAGSLLDKALLTGDIAYVHLARQVVMERAYMVRVADEDGWEVASKMATTDLSDPMSEILGSKRERARLATQHFLKPINQTISPVQTPIFQMGGVSMTQFTQMQPYVYQPGFYQQFSNQPAPQQGFSPNAALPSLGQQRSYSPSPYWPKKGDKNKWSKGKEVVCYLCEGKEHFANECSSRKHLVCDREDSRSDKNKIFEENNKTVSGGVKVVKGGNSFVFEKFNVFSDQFKPEALSFYTGGDALVEKGVAKIGDCRGYSKGWRENCLSNWSSGSKPSVSSSKTEP
ncbi:18227_t:CDS:2, partial [Racocetra persica]